MWTVGINIEVEHCQHCTPQFWYLEVDEGKAPQFAYKGFPAQGQVVLSKNRVIVLCSRCSPMVETVDLAKRLS